jgi:hypothetical protein
VEGVWSSLHDLDGNAVILGNRGRLAFSHALSKPVADLYPPVGRVGREQSPESKIVEDTVVVPERMHTGGYIRDR